MRPSYLQRIRHSCNYQECLIEPITEKKYSFLTELSYFPSPASERYIYNDKNLEFAPITDYIAA